MHHRLIEFAGRLMNTGRVHQDDLAAGQVADAGNLVAGGLGTPGNRRQFTGYQMVEQGRFPHVGLADEARVT